jgi:hypothetical protein
MLPFLVKPIIVLDRAVVLDVTVLSTTTWPTS